MKYLTSTLVMSLLMTAVLFGQEKKPTDGSPMLADGPVITFESTTVDYGVIEHNADGKREFHFTNTGTQDLIIQQCQGSCGCTVPECPKEVYAPGESGIISVKYATNRIGKFTKTVTVNSNATNNPMVLTIKGEVLAPPPAPTGTTGTTGSNH